MKPWQQKSWCLAKIDTEYVKRMEEILDLYAQAYDSRRPVVCVDEFSLTLQDEKVLPLAAKPGSPQKNDYEYIRKGTCSVFVVVEPLAGKRWALVTGRRGKTEFVEVIRQIVEEWYPPETCDEIALVMDNLNTHKLANLYEYLEPSRARENIKRLQVHFTPIHASWLNQAEIEIGALMTQSLRRRIKSVDMLINELSACVEERNLQEKKIDWQFTSERARKKLKRHYPAVGKTYKPPEFFKETFATKH